jgi:5-methylcytosine-specific restriction protein A
MAKAKRNPKWNWEELILALDLCLGNTEVRPWRQIIRETKLPEDLKQLRKSTGAAGSDTLRNVEGVYQKMQNFIHLDPDCKANGQRGRPHGSTLDEVVWDEFNAHPEALKKACQSIRKATKEKSKNLNRPPKASALTPGDISAMEGERIEQRSYRRKRDQGLRWTAWNNAGGVGAACGVNYSKLLAGKGAKVLQVHHKGQLSHLDAPKLHTPNDLAVVCANCHALIHMNPKKPLPIKVLRAMLSKST